jgi:hypothetical protein
MRHTWWDENPFLRVELGALHADADGCVAFDNEVQLIRDGVLPQLQLLFGLEADELGNQPGTVEKRNAGGSLRREAPAVGYAKDFHDVRSRP